MQENTPCRISGLQMSRTHTSQSTSIHHPGRDADATSALLRMGETVARVDTPVEQPDRQADSAVTTPFSPPAVAWQPGSGTVETGIGHVVDEPLLPDTAAAQVADGVRTSVPHPTGPLQLKPAWEVDYFRWPRLARRLLKMHFDLFDRIGQHAVEHMRPTRRRIGICSSFPREGKTTLAICLARWGALSGYRTLLVDADVDRPSLTNCSGLDIGYGWRQCLTGETPVTESMIRSVETGLTFIPASPGDSPAIHEKVLGGLCQMTCRMKYEFDFVMVDLGTIESICVHGTEGMDLVDSVLIARDPSRTSVGQMMDTRTVLHNLGMADTLVAANFARGKVA